MHHIMVAGHLNWERGGVNKRFELPLGFLVHGQMRNENCFKNLGGLLGFFGV